MQATIFVRPETLKTLQAIEPLDYYDRVTLSDDPTTDLTAAPGYFLNAAALRLVPLPADARIALRLAPTDDDSYIRTITAPKELRGVVYAGAPHLPPNYQSIIRYWSPMTLHPYHQNAVYYQNYHNSYLVRLTVADDKDPMDEYAERVPADELLTDGIVFCVTGLAARLEDYEPQNFVELLLPIDPVILGIEHDGMQSNAEYRCDGVDQWETIYLRVADIMASPNPNLLAFSALRSEFQTYGYVY